MKTMNSNKLITLIALGAALTLSGTGCRHTPQHTSTIVGQPGPVNPPPTGPDTALPMGNGNGSVGSQPITTPMNGGGPVGPGHEGWIAHPDVLQADTIHFDYDKSAIRASEESKLSAVIDYLKNNPNAAVRVEGNCDERGTEEYNRALGERRALAARERIAQAGVDPTRVDIVTYGKDKPVDTGNSEAAHARNRRDDFVVLTPPGQ
jgi:peptidoglycan-associated lipoprotein